MNKKLLFFAAMCVSAVGCNNDNNNDSETVVIEDVSIEFSGISFTKAVNSDAGSYKILGDSLVFEDNRNWFKYAFECDEKYRNRIVTVRIIGSSDDNNHDIIPQGYVYLRIASNVAQIGFYYSLDGADWNLARIYKNEYPEKLLLGISAQSPKKGGNTVSFTDMIMREGYISDPRRGE